MMGRGGGIGPYGNPIEKNAEAQRARRQIPWPGNTGEKGMEGGHEWHE